MIYEVNNQVNNQVNKPTQSKDLLLNSFDFT